MITVHKITIVGYVIDQDFGGTPCTPANWPLETIVREMGANVSITETLLDTIDEDDLTAPNQTDGPPASQQGA